MTRQRILRFGILQLELEHYNRKKSRKPSDVFAARHTVKACGEIGSLEGDFYALTSVQIQFLPKVGRDAIPELMLWWE